MTVSAVVPRIQHVAPGGPATYPITFKFYLAEELVVTTTDLLGVDTVRTLAVDYTVAGGDSGDGKPQTGSIDATFTAGHIVTIERILPLTQGSEFSDGGDVPAVTLNSVADRAVMMIQQVAATIGRAVRLSTTSPLAALFMPDPAPDQLLGWNADGTALENKNLPAGTAVYASVPNTLAGLSTNEAVTPAGLKAYVDDLDLGEAASLDAGTGPNELVQLDGSGALPPVDGSQLTGISGGDPLFRYLYFGY